MELLGLAFFGNELLQFGNLQILTVKSEIVIEHLCEHTEDSRFVLIDRTLDINIEQDGIGSTLGGAVDQHKGGGIIGEFLTEPLHGPFSLNFLVFQKIGQHF